MCTGISCKHTTKRRKTEGKVEGRIEVTEKRGRRLMQLLDDHMENRVYWKLTFRDLAPYIQDGRKITLQMPHFTFIQQISVLNILNMLYNLHFFSSKCRLFHNATLFSFCITHILNTGYGKIKKKIRRQKVKSGLGGGGIFENKL